MGTDYDSSFARLHQRLDETGGGTGERCPSLHDDPSTLSGQTRCALDVGHSGDHIHTNGYRTLEWP